MTRSLQLDIQDDGFLSLMDDNGSTKDDVKLPEGDVGDRINKLFREDEKDTSMFQPCLPPRYPSSPANGSSRRLRPDLHG